MSTMDIMEWSRGIVNTLIRRNNDSRYLYHINITLAPNPLDYDGIDATVIEIVEVDQRAKEKKSYFTTSLWNCNLDDAMAEVDKFVNGAT